MAPLRAMHLAAIDAGPLRRTVLVAGPEYIGYDMQWRDYIYERKAEPHA